MPPTKQPADPRFQRPYPSHRRQRATRRESGSLRKLFLQLTAVVAVLLVVALVIILHTDGSGDALSSSSSLPAPVGQ